MNWLNKFADEAEARRPTGEVLIESGVSPSGTYHVGTLREVLTCDAVMLELRRRGRQARHIHYCDDLDVFRKVPSNVPAEYEKYLGKPVCDVPAPDGSNQSYADYFLNDFLQAAKKLRLDMEVIRSHERYQSGFMVPAIEKALTNVDKIRSIIEEVSGRKLEKDWAPIQVNEGGYLKNRRFVSIDTDAKSIVYLGADNDENTIGYGAGDVKLTWRVDWPARWWLLHVDVEPFGRDHGTKGGSYDTGAAICKEVFGTEAPVPLTYNFIIRSGETKKMSKSAGDVIAISEMADVLPPEIVRYFTLHMPADRQLFFDPEHGVTKLIDDYAALLAKPDKTDSERQLIELSNNGGEPTVSGIPFSHLTASYQGALKDAGKTLEVIGRTEYKDLAKTQAETIKKELAFIDKWLSSWAPEDVKFELAAKPPKAVDEKERDFLAKLAGKIEQAPADADGEWFHKAVYDLKGQSGLEPKEMFSVLYQTLIGKDQGPRAGWFLSILPRDWLIKRLRLEA